MNSSRREGAIALITEQRSPEKHRLLTKSQNLMSELRQHVIGTALTWFIGGGDPIYGRIATEVKGPNRSPYHKQVIDSLSD